MKPIAVTLMGVALMWSAAASAWETQVSTEYRIGDSESRVMARENAYQALKVEAAGEAKTYIQGTETLSNGELSETIKVMGASLVELDDVETEFSLSDDGTQVMSVTGTASVDESVLKERMRQIQQDKSKQQAIERLSDKNDQLRQRIERLRRQQESASNDAAMAENLESQAEAYREIEKLNNSVTDVFERGTLLNMADQSGSQIEKIKKKYKTAFLAP